ncbi:hypothetical protein HDU77_010409 [Chytriomyces hyalinus]|nr:hypothetical protein HDU77_010409 [Chytriomyces hyalinus]
MAHEANFLQMFVLRPAPGDPTTSTVAAAAATVTSSDPSAATSAAFVAPTKELGNVSASGCGALQATFNTCAANALFDPTSLKYFRSISDICGPQANLGQLQLYTCICEKASAIEYCFSLDCPSDTANYAASTQYKNENCAALASLQPKVSVPVASPVITGSGAGNGGGPVLNLPPGGSAGGSAAAGSGSSVGTTGGAGAAGSSANAKSAGMSVVGGWSVAAAVVVGVVAL